MLNRGNTHSMWLNKGSTLMPVTLINSTGSHRLRSWKATNLQSAWMNTYQKISLLVFSQKLVPDQSVCTLQPSPLIILTKSKMWASKPSLTSITANQWMNTRQNSAWDRKYACKQCVSRETDSRCTLWATKYTRLPNINLDSSRMVDWLSAPRKWNYFLQ